MSTATANLPFLEYASAGLSVIPIKMDGTKAPDASKWKPFQETIADEKQLQAWARRIGRIGIGVIGGKVSGGLEIIDFDDPGLVGPYFDALASENPYLREKLTLIRTPRRNDAGQWGLHAVYRCQKYASNTTLAQSEPRPQWNRDGTPKIDPSTGDQKIESDTLIETRGEGGYVLTVGCPPECHPTGRLYEHVEGPPLTEVQIITEGERETLWRLARSFDRLCASAYEEPQQPEYRSNGQQTESPGDMFAKSKSWEEILCPYGWEIVHHSGEKTFWRRPGKTDPGWSATTGCKSQKGVDLFCCFSSNASPFQGAQNGRTCSCYSKFGAYTFLNHGGDFKEAARALVKLGFGGRAESQSSSSSQNGQAAGDSSTSEPRKNPVVLERIPAVELAERVCAMTFLINSVLVESQPCVMGGPSKSLKTSLLCDLAISLVSGQKFLGQFNVQRTARVGFFNGESGLLTLKETAIRIAASKGITLGDLGTGLIFSTTLPRLNHLDHRDALMRFIQDDELTCVIIDPAYLAFSSVADRASNVFSMGELLLPVAELCGQAGVTLIICHHTKRGREDRYAPAELEELTWAGWSEFARQWLLVSRRAAYEDGTGHHDLWLRTGGSVGHSGLWSLDISEGTNTAVEGRTWEVAVGTVSDAKQAAEQQQDARKSEARSKLDKEYRRRVLDALRKLPQGETATGLRMLTGLNAERLGIALRVLLAEGRIEPCQVSKAGKIHEGFRWTGK